MFSLGASIMLRPLLAWRMMETENPRSKDRWFQRFQEWFLCKTTFPRGLLPSVSSVGFSHDISSEAAQMEILDKDSTNPSGNVR